MPHGLQALLQPRGVSHPSRHRLAPSVCPMFKPSLEPTHRLGSADISGKARFVQQNLGVYNGWKTLRLDTVVGASFSQNSFSDKDYTHI